jgi:hypothetical protein
LIRPVDVWSGGYVHGGPALEWWQQFENHTGEVWLPIDDFGRRLMAGDSIPEALDKISTYNFLSDDREVPLGPVLAAVLGEGGRLWLTTSLFEPAQSSSDYHDERDPLSPQREAEVQRELARHVPADIREISNEPFSGGAGAYSVEEYQRKLEHVAPAIRQEDNSCEICATWHPALIYPDAVTMVGVHVFEPSGLSAADQAEKARLEVVAAKTSGRKVAMDESSWVGPVTNPETREGTMWSNRGAHKVELMARALIDEGVVALGAWMTLPRPMVWGREWEISCWDLEGWISGGGIAFEQSLTRTSGDPEMTNEEVRAILLDIKERAITTRNEAESTREQAELAELDSRRVVRRINKYLKDLEE